MTEYQRRYTRQSVIDDGYRLDEDGIICSPGKFESEPWYVVRFWEDGLDGFVDEDEDGVWTFNLTNEDRAIDPHLANVRSVLLWATDDGFIYSELVPGRNGCP